MTSLVFYTKPVGLNTSEHKDLKIVPRPDDFSFATKTNSVILAGVEFTEAAKEFPIVFIFLYFTRLKSLLTSI